MQTCSRVALCPGIIAAVCVMVQYAKLPSCLCVFSAFYVFAATKIFLLQLLIGSRRNAQTYESLLVGNPNPNRSTIHTI